MVERGCAPDGKPKATPIRTGINDGQWVEVTGGLTEGTPVIVGVSGGAGAPAGPRPSGSPGANNPFAPQFQRRQRG